MKQGWDDYERAADRGPLAVAVKAIFGIAVVCAIIGGIGYAFGWFGEAAKVAQDEFGPRAALDKYMWLKEAHAQLDKKRADIGVYESRMKAMEESYKDLPRQKWPREDREQYNVWSSEVAGVKASYNDLAAQYNAKMKEVNWRFANQGDLPQGATETLPREYAPYITQ